MFPFREYGRMPFRSEIVEEIYLNDNYISEFKINPFDFPNNPNYLSELTTLELRNNRLTSFEYRYRSDYLKKIKVIDLRNNPPCKITVYNVYPGSINILKDNFSVIE
jgi:Leucine-rich repeat (LRR) protein